jgi:ferrous iron transport protein A
MQLSFNKVCGRRRRAPATLGELRLGEQGILDRLDLPEGDARRLMELGFLPGSTVFAACCAPGGDPRVFRVDGSEVALRADMASRIALRPVPTVK